MKLKNNDQTTVFFILSTRNDQKDFSSQCLILSVGQFVRILDTGLSSRLDRSIDRHSEKKTKIFQIPNFSNF